MCDHGSNRSVHVADLLRWRGHETIPVGVQHLSPETVAMLIDWADRIILTGVSQRDHFAARVDGVELWPLPENPRPYNPDTLRLVRGYISSSGL